MLQSHERLSITMFINTFFSYGYFMVVLFRQGLCLLFFFYFHFVYANCTFLSFVYMFFIIIFHLFLSLFACVPNFVHVSMCLLLQAIKSSALSASRPLGQSQTSVVKGIHWDFLGGYFVGSLTYTSPAMPATYSSSHDQCAVWMSPRELSLL